MNNEFISDLIKELSYSFGEREVQIILNDVNKVISNYNFTKIETYDLATIDDYNDQMLKRYQIKKDMSGISSESIKQYVRHARNLLFTLNKRACDITSQDIENYLVVHKYTNDVTNTTLNNMRTYINNFFEFLFQEEIIPRNPVAKVPKIKRDTIRDTAISKTEEEQLYSVCDNLRNRAIMETLFATGCRVSELVNIRIKDIDFYGRTINVIGKGNKERTICISEKAIYHVQKYLNSRKGNSEYLFISNRAPYGKLTSDAIQSMLKKIGELANVDNVHPHRFRATFCTRLIDSGMDIQQVSKLMGHASIDTTMIYYRGDFNLANDYKRVTNI